jgi:hypothetical protein
MAMLKMRWSPEVIDPSVYNDNGDFDMQKKKINPQIKKINLQVLTNILKLKFRS